MNELNKLIEQYHGDQKEILEYVKTLSWGQTSRERKLYKFLKYFASRPTVLGLAKLGILKTKRSNYY